MKTAKAGKPTGQQSGTASPKPVKSWSKVAASSAPKPVQQEQQQQQSKDIDGTTKASHDKLLAILDGLINTEAEVSTKGGAKYRGFVKSVDVQGDVAVVLRNAKQISSGSNGSMNGTDTVLSELAIKPNELIEVHAAKVELTRPEDSGSSTPAPAQNAWKTDTDISGRGQIKERVLQAWQPSPDDEGFSIEDDLSTATKTGTTTKKWDQFAANEKLFGVKSQWDEDMYTHKLDTTRPDFARRQAEAERLAREIEQSSSTNAHVLEERGVVDDSGLTEEDKYSGVQRNPNAWVPPARRPIVNLPTPRVSSVDPAIISSQLAKPGSSGHRSMVSEINVQRPTSGENNKSNDAAPTSVSKTANAIETDIMARFKQFATNERDRLSVKKAATFKKEKDGRLQDLLAFSKDFKLSTPVPEDLIPILAKDKAKQEAIVQKAASGSSSSPSTAKPESPATKPVDSKSDTLRSRLDKAHQAPVPQATPTPLTREQSTELKKLKPSAAEFKPFNPAATSFTPSFAQKQPQSSSPALSTASSQPRQSQFSVEASAFFARPPKLVSERPSILEQFDPFKTYAAKNPTSVLDIETPLKVDPAWPSTQNSPSITDPPQDSRRIPLAEEQFSNQQQYISGPSPQMGFTGSPQQSHSFQQQPNYYSNKNQQFIPAPPGQFSPYQTAHSFVPPQYMYPGVQGYNPRMMQPHIMQVPYPPQQFNNYNPALTGPQQMMPNGYNTGSPRARQGMAPSQRSPEIQKPTPRPPPMSSEATKQT